MSNDLPIHADHIEDADEKRRRKWAEFIINNPDAFYAALKGISEARHLAEQKEALDRDFAPDKLTDQDRAALDKIEKQMIERPGPEAARQTWELVQEPDGRYSLAPPLELDSFDVDGKNNIRIARHEALNIGTERGVNIDSIRYYEYKLGYRDATEAQRAIRGQMRVDPDDDKSKEFTLRRENGTYYVHGSAQEYGYEISDEDAQEYARHRGASLNDVLESAIRDTPYGWEDDYPDETPEADNRKEGREPSKTKGEPILPPSRWPEEERKAWEAEQQEKAQRSRGQDKDHER